MSGIDRQDRIFVAGHRGLVGSAIVRRLERGGYGNIVTRGRAELDLRRQAEVEAFFEAEPVDVVVLAAATVGGIHANNTRRAEFIRDNLQLQTNVIDAAWKSGVSRLLFLGSSCIYPRDCPQPMREEHLLSGELEHTNEPYAIAKIAGLKMCEAYNDQYGTRFVTVMPTNLYGPGDNFDLQSSHVLPALIRKIHAAAAAGEPRVTLWGSGRPKREFLHVDDLADACVFLMEHNAADADPQWNMVNIGSGEEVSILDLARMIAGVVGFEGEFVFDTDMPDGTPRKLLDSSRIRALGWSPGIDLAAGLRDTYRWYLEHAAEEAA
ncbi:MAG TPA: GDP-L-fucose synthase [Arenicellales bacterium]|nr:GDP-L-fucose synthase [Arenicellales bacterium]